MWLTSRPAPTHVTINLCSCGVLLLRYHLYKARRDGLLYEHCDRDIIPVACFAVVLISLELKRSLLFIAIGGHICGEPIRRDILTVFVQEWALIDHIK